MKINEEEAKKLHEYESDILKRLQRQEDYKNSFKNQNIINKD